MIDERNINNIIELIESSNQKIKTIKDSIEEQKSTFELPKNEFKNLSTCVEEVLKAKNFDKVQELFGNLNKNIIFKTDFLKEQYKTLDDNIFKVQNIAKHIDKDISEDVNSLIEIVETFSYKIKILQGIVGDVNTKIDSFSGENAERFLKDFRSDCGDFDEEFDQVLRELKQNFKKASDITAKLSKLDTGVDLAKELFTINVSINAIMSSISVFDEKYKDLGKAFAESGLYTDFSAKMEDLSYNTKHLIRNIDNFNKVIEEGSSVKDQVKSLEQRIETINNLIQIMNQEGLLEIKALLNSIDDSDDLNEIKNSLNALSSTNQDEKFDAIKEEIKESIASFNQDEKFSELKTTILSAQDNNEVLQEIKMIVSNLENIKVLGQFEFILKEIHQGEKVSQDKLDELLKITSVVNFGEVEKEISFLSNDLEIILEEIKHGRSISDKSFSKLETIFESFNLMEIKNRLFEFENYLKKFLKKEDLQTFANDIQAITEKFELANSVIIDGFDDVETLKNYILGFEEKFAVLTDNVKNILEENQEKFDSAIEAFDTNYKIDELTNTANEVMAQVTLSKTNILTVLNEGQEKIELLIKAMDSSDKFEEMQEVIKNNLDQIQSESNAKIQELGEISRAVGEDMESLKASMLGVIRENQNKFNEMLSSLDDKVNNQEIQEKLDSVIQSLENKSNDTELQVVSSKLMDEVNNGKYLVIDSIREAQLKLEEFVASVDNAHRIEELKNVTSHLQEELFKTKDAVLNSIRDNQDRFELMIRALDDSDKIDDVNELSKTIYSEVISSKNALLATLRTNQEKIEEAIKLTDVNSKIDGLESLSQRIIEEVKFAKEITQNVGRSINLDVLNDLQNSIDELKSSIGGAQDAVVLLESKLDNMADKTDVSMISELVKERHEQLEYLIRAYDPTADISAIRDNMDGLLQQEEFDEIKQKIDSNKDVVYELRSVLEERTRDLELLMKSVENTDDINELKDILYTIDNEQKDIKNAMDFLAKHAESSEVSDEINGLRDILYNIDNEQKNIRNIVETSFKSTENADDINYLKGILSDMDQEQRDIKSALDYVVKQSENSDIPADISELKDILFTLSNEQKDIKNAMEFVAKNAEDAEISHEINGLRDILFNIEHSQNDIKNIIEMSSKSTENNDDINYLKGILADMEHEQKDIKSALDYVVKQSESSDILGLSGDINEIKYKIEELNTKDDLNEIRQKLEHNKDVVYELRSVLEERTRNLELIMKSVENTDDISELKDILLNMDNEQADIKNAVNFIAKASENSEISADISELKDILFTLNNEQKDIKNIIENTLKSVENADDINYLKGILSDMEQEQKDIKSALDNEEVKTSLEIIENKIDSISAIKGDISSLEREMVNFKSGFDGVLRQEDVSNTFETIYEIRNDISSFSNDISSLKKELEEISSNKDIEEAVEQLENIQYVIKESISENTAIASNINALEGKIDEIKSATDLNYDLKTLLGNIQEDQLTLKALVSSMDDDETINAIKDQIKSSEYVIRDVVEANRAKEDIEQLKYQVENLTQQIVVQVMQVFDNISFEQEAQEIKEFVDESHNGVKNVLSALKSNIERLLDAPKPIYIEELRQEIEKVAKNLDSIGPEMSEYVSTITSLRVSLEELAKAKDMVNLLEQNISNVSIEVDEILRISRDISAQFDLVYTHNEAKDDFAKIRTALDNIIEKQQEQSESGQKESAQREDLKGGIDNVNLSINYINENLNEFLGEYRIFQDRLADTMHNMESMASTFVQSDSINSEYKQGVSETFKSLKKDFGSVITTVGNLYHDISKVTVLTGEMLDTSAKDKAEILQNMQNLKEIIESSDIDKLKDNFSTIIFSINGFMNNVDEKFAVVSHDTKGAYEFAYENKEIAENIKTSIVHILEWTNSASRDFSRIQSSIESFRDVFEESAEDIRQISEIKSIVADLDSALASRVEEVFDRQFQSKLDNQLLPEFELLDKKIEKKLVQKLSPILEAREQDKDDLRFVINNQLSEETASLKELIDIVEKNIVVKIQHGFEQISNQDLDLDFSPIVDKLDSEFALVNDKIDDSLSKIDTELYQANVKIEDGLSRINDEFSSLSSNVEDGLDKINRNVKNINFAEVNSKIEQGFGEITQKIDDTNLPQVVSKIDDEFSAMNKKLDVDFFEMNKRVVDEFNLIEEKLDDRTENLLQNIENSNGQLASEIGKFTNRIESKTEQTLGNIDSRLESQKEILVRNIEATNNKLTSEMSQFVAKLATQSGQTLGEFENVKTEIVQEFTQLSEKLDDKNQSLIKNIETTNNQLTSEMSQVTEKIATQSEQTLSKFENIKTEISQEFVQLVDKFDGKNQTLIKNIEDATIKAKQELAQTTGVLSSQSSNVLKNIEEVKAEIQQLLNKFEGYSSSVSEKLNATKENLETKLETTESKIDVSLEEIKNEIVKDVDASLDKISNKLNNQSVILKNIEDTKAIVSQLAEKSDSQSEENMTLVLNNLEQAKESMLYLAKNLESSQDSIGKLSETIENQSKSFVGTVNSAKKDLNQEIKALANNNASSILGNINQSKDEIKLEFVQLVEKIDLQAERLNSLETTKDEIHNISGGIAEAKNELNVISGKLDAQTGLVIKNVEDSNSKLDKTLAQVTSKLDNQSKTVLKSLADNQKALEQSITDINGKIDTQTGIVFNNLGESKVELDDISKKITAQSELVVKNIEESKEELEQELVHIIDKIDSQSENLAKAQDKKLKAFEEKLNDQDKKMQAIDEKLDVLIERLNTAQSLDLSEIVIELEKRMGSLDENIKKIVSFVDEE